ncbi:replication initiation protein [Blautia producta]|uniref:replication initiation protein n=1 Tax=Blautia producta TaxID=33035 RepID=UPI003569ADBC
MKNSLDNRSVKLTRELICKPTKFNAELQRLFYITLASANINYDLPLKPYNAIAIKKSDLFEKLNVTDSDRHFRYRKLFNKMQRASFFTFNDNDSYEDGYIFYHVSGNRHYWYIYVNEMFMPIIQNVSSNYVQLLLDDAIYFQSKFSMTLYQNLLSLNNECVIDSSTYKVADYTTRQLKDIFGMEIGDYVRKDGSFARKHFETYCIEKAVIEINSNSKLIKNLTWSKEYYGRNVGKYVFTYQVDDIDRYKYGEESYQKLLQHPKTAKTA